MNLAKSLTYSKEACHYVLKVAKLEAANWDQYSGAGSWEDCIGRFGDRLVCEPRKDTVDVCLYDVVRPKAKRLAKGKAGIDFMRILANTAKVNQCGNCGEFSALAFMYLYDLGVGPLDWMSLVGGDHAFVVIGRVDGDANQVGRWGANASVCDPWGRGFRGDDVKTGTYAGSAFKKQMGGLVSFTGVRSLHREG